MPAKSGVAGAILLVVPKCDGEFAVIVHVLTHWETAAAECNSVRYQLLKVQQVLSDKYHESEKESVRLEPFTGASEHVQFP